MEDKIPKYRIFDVHNTATNRAKSSVLIIYTGGTIGMEHDASGTLVPLNFNHIVKRVPPLKTLDIKLTVISFSAPLDSSNVTIAEWQDLAFIIHENRQRYDGFVVLHGTDTMSFTASAISFMLRGLNKPIIFTGAQLPISAIRSDARPNLVTALEIAAAKVNGVPRVPEVCVYFDYQLMRGNRTYKKRSSQFAAFGCDNYPILAKAGISISYNEAQIMAYQPEAKLDYRDRFCNDVIIIKIFPSLKETALRHLLATPGLQGVVMETYGSGNAPTQRWFLDCLSEAVGRGIIIYNVSQLTGGIVVQGRYETSKYLEEIGVVSGSDISREAAIVKLMFLLGNETDRTLIKQKLRASLSGELSALK
ncbi:MAG: asparaginase [Cyclobacteriaceae bacterium]|nr:asparaginase [Cyclobacteriaceae bacterium]